MLVQNVTVERAAGGINVVASPIDATGRFDVTVTDTRADDPGWSVRVSLTDAAGRSQEWKPTAIEPTPAFTAADGESYAQRVRAARNGLLASAPRGHGLGIAHLIAATTPASAATGGHPVAVNVTIV
jgi:hypothetical protein